MMEQADRILAVVQDPASLEILSDAAVRAFDAQITCAYSGSDALDIDDVETHHIAIVTLDQPDMSGFELARRLLKIHFRPVIMIAPNPTGEEVMEALRLGVTDFLSTPLDRDPLVKSLSRCLCRGRAMRRTRDRQKKQRLMVRRLLRDRRNLNQRIELICRDMVGAYRRVFHRVLTLENPTHRDSIA